MSFIVFEGLDGAGGETQTDLLCKYFKKEGNRVNALAYPDYQGAIGQLIDKFLHKGCDFSPGVQALLYFADFVKDSKKVRQWLDDGHMVISDRYLGSTLAYQTIQGLAMEKILKLGSLFELIRPHLVVYLKVSPEVSMKRKYGEKKNLDRYESNKEFLAELEKCYEKLADEQVFGKWVIIDAEQCIDDVFSDVKKAVEKYI